MDDREDALAKHVAATESELAGRERRIADAESRAATAQAEAEKLRNEMQRRVREINSKINQDKITDAIDLAQQTMETMGPDPNVTQLLHGAEEKRKKKDDAEKKFSAAETLVIKGDHQGATRLLNEVMATQIFQASDPRMQDLRGKIEVLASGQGKRNAILAAGLLGVATLLGVLLTSALEGQLKYALPLSGGVTLYVAATDLLPEVNREPNWRLALLVFVGVASLLIMQHLFHV